MSLADYDRTWQIVERPISVSAKSSSSKPPTPGQAIPSIAVEDLSAKAGDHASAQPAPEQTLEEEGTDASGQESNDESGDATIFKIMDITEMETPTGQAITTKTRRFRKPKNKKKDRFQDYAGILRRKLDEQGQPISVNLEIKSPFLRKAFKEILKDFERINLDADPIIIPKPYVPLFYRQEEIKAYQGKGKSKGAEQEMDVILEFMDLNLEDIRQEYDRNVPNGKVTSALAWTLFPPGTVIVANAASSSPAQCLIVKDCKNFPGMLELKCSMWQYNGRTFGYSRRLIRVELPQNAGSFPITDLFAYPLKFHHDEETFRKLLVERGRKYAKIVRRAHMSYNGVVWTQDPIDLEVIQVHVKGRVMIDHALYIQQCPPTAPRLEDDPGVDTEECETEPCFCGIPSCTIGLKKKDVAKAEANKKVEVHEPRELSEEEALLCPGKVKGFALTDKCWAEFRVDRLTDITWNKAAYSRLELDEKLKKVISALVNSHRKHSMLGSAEFDDIIAGKGLGLVFLLQGPPGLGKTLTAETVSEQSEKPLYAVTSGELGTTVHDMETALAKAFRIAKEWNAILLLDEADVFLSKRSDDNFEKNAFVSVFLRLMEYYQGILFLTTNRAEDFDPAFLSRIHLIIDYKPLTAIQRANIWKNLSANMDKDDSLSDAGLEALGKEFDINGREIKNLLRTAWCLAKQSTGRLSLEDVRTVAQLSTGYTTAKTVASRPK